MAPTVHEKQPLSERHRLEFEAFEVLQVAPQTNLKVNLNTLLLLLHNYQYLESG